MTDLPKHLCAFELAFVASHTPHLFGLLFCLDLLSFICAYWLLMLVLIVSAIYPILRSCKDLRIVEIELICLSDLS